jgi:hypothetical protein
LRRLLGEPFTRGLAFGLVEAVVLVAVELPDDAPLLGHQRPWPDALARH